MEGPPHMSYFLQESQWLKSHFRMGQIIMQGTVSLLLTVSIISLPDIKFIYSNYRFSIVHASQTALCLLPLHLPMSYVQ